MQSSGKSASGIGRWAFFHSRKAPLEPPSEQVGDDGPNSNWPRNPTYPGSTRKPALAMINDIPTLLKPCAVMMISNERKSISRNVLNLGHLIENDVPKGSRHSGLFLLFGPAHIRHGRDDLCLPFHESDLPKVMSFFSLPTKFLEMMKEETTRCFRTTLFNREGGVTSFVFSIKYFSWWLGTGSLSLSHNPYSGEVRVLLLGPESDEFQADIFERVQAKEALTGHPFLVPLVICDHLATKLGAELHISSKRIFQLEQTIGVNDYGDSDLGAKPEHQEQADLDFADINRSLNGELSRLANYEKFAKSQISLLVTILADIVLSLDQDHFSFLIITQMREYGEGLLGWNKELLARIECQQKIVDGQIQTLYNLLAQRDNKLNYTIAEASRRDSTAMKTIAIVTMMFLPGAYIATLFSMNMFNWHAAAGEHILSNNFWVYWAVTLPITALVLLIWAAWSRPWAR
ncbi:hypothetical protein BKA65DRAFT_221606 [Rhexocercosporidium sp. MPI-PUGE-AT-0058]|nr:hypothetical protein BKA65DRAFT_221606 [Rhexocercosporidium sp. MPI-PUGE-AT-0058]